MVSEPPLIVLWTTKGGAGKSTCAVALAKELKAAGHVVGINDLDFSNHNIPDLLGDTKRRVPRLGDRVFLPWQVGGFSVFSVGYLAETDWAIMMAGRTKRDMAVYLLDEGVQWPEGTEFVIVDMPPQSDEIAAAMLERFKFSKRHGCVILVTRPEKQDIADLGRAVKMMEEYEVKPAGVIVTQGAFRCPNCNSLTIMGDDKDRELVPKKMCGLPLLGDMPLVGAGQERKFFYIAKNEIVKLARKRPVKGVMLW